jgi:uncharacterized protein YbbC (DUF1343 family)
MKQWLLVLLIGCASCARMDMAQSNRGDGGDAQVLCGADVIEREGYKQLAGKRVALVTNQTGRDRAGNRLPDLLAKAPDVKLVRLLAPEHGLYGTQDEKIKDVTDPATKLPVLSIYGATKRPTTQMVQDIDAIVYDLQDVGARFYTVSATLGLCLESAAEHHVQLIVLDRPCPITGTIVDGPIADKDKLGFTAYGPIPVAHGMTMGELARYFNSEYKIGADLVVIPCENWRREMWWDSTGLVWGNSSPNMRNTTAALLYTGICLLEGSNVSVGRGTNQPFEFFGAPWIDGQKLAPALNAQKIPGVRFVPVEFTPTASRFKDEKCQGCYVIVTDRQAIQPVRMGTTIVWQLKKMYGDQFQFEKVNNLLKNDAAMKAIAGAKDPKEIPAVWEKDLAAFIAARKKYLLYP